MKMTKYPSIDQFRSIVKQVKDSATYVGKDENGEAIHDITRRPPTLTFTGTTKLHGTNSAVCFEFNDAGSYWCQSRENIVTPVKDNAGFATYVYSHKDEFINLMGEIEDQLSDTLDRNHSFYGAAIYGEFCGGSIQKGVGINGLPKMFVVFGIKLLSDNPDFPNEWLSDNFVQFVVDNQPDINLYNIFDFGKYSIDIDFNHPELAQNKLIELTEEVERECPVAKHFGIENGCGEGIVWTCLHNGVVYRFKCKGPLHSISKVKVLVPIDIEKVNSINELVENIVTENRLLQGLEHLTMAGIEHDIKNTGAFIKWVNQDLIKEEIDLIIGSGFELKEVLTPAGKKAREWFFNQIFI
jgi:RNA ligase